MRPYTPLELAGRNIYVREGCYNCHSQMIRPLRDEVERYGHYSLAAESMYDRPFQWGSKRTGPDLARVGGKYSDDWHRDHLNAPKSVVPGTVMPAYPWLARTELDFAHIADDLKVQSLARRALYAGDDRNAPAPICARRRRRSSRRRCDCRSAIRTRRRATFDGNPRHDHGSRRADRLSADARHAGRLQALRQQSQHPLSRVMNEHLQTGRRIRPDLGTGLLRRDVPRRRRLRASGRRTRRSSTTPPACRSTRTEQWQADSKRPVDAVTGTETTGHEWDGIRELNTPLPRWWLWLFYVTIVWSIGYWIVYPAWPLVTGYTQGVLGWNSRSAIADRSRRPAGAARRR